MRQYRSFPLSTFRFGIDFNTKQNTTPPGNHHRAVFLLSADKGLELGIHREVIFEPYSRKPLCDNRKTLHFSTFFTTIYNA